MRKRNKKRYLDGLIKGEAGWTTVETIIVLPLLFVAVFAMIQYWGVFSIYLGTQENKFRALSKMRLDGGLTLVEKQNLEENLVKLGADPATLQIEGDVLYEGVQPVLWPNDIALKIKFIPKHFNSFSAKILINGDPGEPVRIGVKGGVVSEKT